jgi:hypothetical protein
MWRRDEGPMSRDSLFIAVLALSLVNGLLSPFLKVFYMLAPVWILYLFPGVSSFLLLPEFVFYLCSLMIATATLLIGGVPAALYERFVPGAYGSTTAMYIWLAGAGLLSLPSVEDIFR